MAYVKVSEARDAARTALSSVQKSAGRILAEDASAFSASKTYDVFLSHSFDDSEIIFGVKKIIERHGLSVYVDWIDDSELDRSRVTVKTADLLRGRMKACLSLVYAHSANSSNSIWMPWELGYFDGIRPGQVWVLPLVSDYDSEFKRQEYLGLYPCVENLGSLAGRTSLGFDNVGSDNHQVLLEKAAKGHRVYYSSD